MNKLLALIIIIMFLAYVPLGPVNYSSELSGIFIFLGNIQNILASTISMIITYIFSLLMVALDNLLPLMIKLYNIVLSLPYEKINYWYVLLALVVVSFFAEKFRTINNELNKLNKKLTNIKEKTQSNDTSKSSAAISALNEKSEAILKLLSEISIAAESFKNNYVRSKKIRRLSLEDIESTHSATTSSAKDEDQLMRLRKDQPLQDNKVDVVTDVDTDIKDTSLTKDEDQLMRLRKDQSLQENGSDDIMNDDNISQIDLARAFVESNERESAIDLIKKIIDTGTEDEKHEAKLLYMQIK